MRHCGGKPVQLRNGILKVPGSRPCHAHPVTLTSTISSLFRRFINL